MNQQQKKIMSEKSMLIEQRKSMEKDKLII